MANEYVDRKVEMKIRAGAKAGWFEVIIGEKKFIMKQVNEFISERTTVEKVFEQ